MKEVTAPHSVAKILDLPVFELRFSPQVVTHQIVHVLLVFVQT